MALIPPNLDDRTFQDIVDEAKSRIPAYFDGWTDHNVSDPGVTLIELFAWMTEMILYRQNQLPDWLTVKMMQLFGLNLDEARAATTDVTFQLSAPQPQAVEIPAGTEVATTQTETQPSIIFSTEQKLTIHPAKLAQVVLKRQAHEEAVVKLDVAHMREQQQVITLFSQRPLPDDAIYFGFMTDLSHHLLQFFFQSVQRLGTDGVDITRPPYLWEGASRDENGEEQWLRCAIELDETRALLLPGRMMVHLPTLHQMPLTVDDSSLYWVRLRVMRESEYEGQPIRPFTQSPRIQQITVQSMGGTVRASHAEVVEHEFLGYSSGAPGQRFWLQSAPILRPDANRKETLCIQLPVQSNHEEPEEEWDWVPDFGSLEEDPKMLAGRKVFTLDTASGELRLPPAQTDALGNVKRYGAIPPRQASLWFNRYRHGGGVIGNVAAYALDTLKTAVPYVNRVYNREAAAGGQDQEPLERAKLRAPHLLHAQNRAVTAADFEYLATRCDVAVGRVKCLQHEPGWVESVDPGTVYVFVLPEVRDPAGRLAKGDLVMPEERRRRIKAYLDDRRLLTVRLHVAQPEIVWAWVRLTCRLAQGADKKEIEKAIERRLYKYINPLVGGPEGAGWPFGRNLFTYDVYACLQGIRDILAILEITLYRPLPDGREKVEKDVLPTPLHGVVALAGCEIVFIL